MSHAAGIDRGNLPDVLLQDLDGAIVVAELDIDARLLGDLRQLGNGKRIAGAGCGREPVWTWCRVPALRFPVRLAPARPARCATPAPAGVPPALPARVVPARCLGRHWPSRAASRRRVHRRTAASRSGKPTMTASNKALASHQSGSGTGGGAFAAASAARCAASCACTSCCMRSTIAVSSTMRWRRMTVSASIEFASSCCARSRSASVRAPSAAPASPAGSRARHRESRPVGGHGRRSLRRGLCRGACLGRGRLARRARTDSGARGCRAARRAARRSPRCARGTARGGTRLRRGHGLARRGFRGDDRGFDRGRIHEQRVFALHRGFAAGLYRDSDDGIVHRARAGDDELRSGGRALDGDAAEQDLRDAVRVALCRRKLEAFRRNVLSGSERYRNDDPQRNSESRLLRDRAESDGRQRQRRERAQDARDGGGKPRHGAAPARRASRRCVLGCAEGAGRRAESWVRFDGEAAVRRGPETIRAVRAQTVV